jgi:hypothetical protein
MVAGTVGGWSSVDAVGWVVVFFVMAFFLVSVLAPVDRT